jgi:H+/Cl- antiporter ClcA
LYQFKTQRNAVNNYEFNPGILVGSIAAILSLLAALAALYLWAVNRASQRLNQTATPQERAVIPWLRPLLLPTLFILCLGMVAQLSKAFEEKSWPEASRTIITGWAAFMILMFWLKLRKKT